MTSDYNNPQLRPEMQPFLAIEGRERLQRCWERVWVPTKATREIFVKLENCLNAPPSTKPRGMVISGESDTGKSSALSTFRDRHRPAIDELDESEYAIHPVIYIRAPDKPDPDEILKRILAALGHPLRYNPTTGDLRRHTVRMIHACRVGVVIIDELQDIQRGHVTARLTDFLIFLRSLINDTGRPFVISGTPVIVDIIAREDQLVGRLNTLVRLEPFKLADFTLVFCALERMLPLRRSSGFRENPSLVYEAFTMSNGYIGRLNNLLQDASERAIETGEERITEDILKQVARQTVASLTRTI